MLYSSYGQRGLHWIYGQPKRLPTYPMRPPHLPTAAIYDLNDSPPNSLFKIPFEQPNSRRLATSLLPPAHSLDGGGVVCWAKRSLTRSVCRFGALPVVLAGRSRGMEPAGPMGRAAAHSCSVQGVATPPPRSPLFAFSGATYAGSRSSGLRQQGRAGQLQGVKS